MFTIHSGRLEVVILVMPVDTWTQLTTATKKNSPAKDEPSSARGEYTTHARAATTLWPQGTLKSACHTCFSLPPATERKEFLTAKKIEGKEGPQHVTLGKTSHV